MNKHGLPHAHDVHGPYFSDDTITKFNVRPRSTILSLWANKCLLPQVPDLREEWEQRRPVSSLAHRAPQLFLPTSPQATVACVARPGGGGLGVRAGSMLSAVWLGPQTAHQ